MFFAELCLTIVGLGRTASQRVSCVCVAELLYLFISRDVAFYSAGSDDLGDLLTRAIFLRQAGIIIRHHRYFPLLTRPALRCMRQRVWQQEKVTIEAEKFVRSNQENYLQLKWNGSALREYTALQE